MKDERKQAMMPLLEDHELHSIKTHTSDERSAAGSFQRISEAVFSLDSYKPPTFNSK
jgi:hypothetical protein